jgi:hypothetical protein
MPRALFIGNSYTYFNEMPSMVAGLAASAGQSLDVHHVTAGGVTLEWHMHNEATLAALCDASWDFVVLQEHSIRPIQDTVKMYQSAAELQALIAPTGAQTVLYLTWARQHFPEMQPGLARVYTGLAREIGARVAPVGLVWQAALAADPSRVLYTSDKSHPTALGSYLAACTFYVTFFEASPVGLAVTLVTTDGAVLIEIPEAQARLLQSVAWDTVRKL